MNDPLFSVAGQIVLISGASRGIGRGIAEGFVQRDAQVIITGRNAESIERTAAEISSDSKAVRPLVCDVSQVASIRAAVESVQQEFGKIDTLVNVAGINLRKPAIDYTEQEYDAIVDINLRGAFFMSQAVGRCMIEQGHGSQINIGSLNTQRALTNLLPYAVAKTGMDQMSRALAVEWGPFGIRVNTLAPGFVQTDLTKKIWADQTMEGWRVANTPQRRIALPEDMVGTAIFLASPASAYLTGQVIYVDGGATAGRMWPLGNEVAPAAKAAKT
jgi:NAD(P)-dependent dehydrogenase (short-subunit alcohol dehydrogenase family)